MSTGQGSSSPEELLSGTGLQQLIPWRWQREWIFHRIRGELAPTKELTLLRRLRRWVYDNSTLNQSLLGFIILTLGLLATCVIAGRTAPSSSDVSASILFSIAEVLAGFAGVVLAVAIFGLEFYTSSVPHFSSIAHRLGRLLGIPILAVLLLSAIASNMLVGVIATLWEPGASFWMLVLDLPVSFAVAFACLWLIALASTTIADGRSDELLECLRWDCEDFIASELCDELVSQILTDELSRRGLKTELAAYFVHHDRPGVVIVSADDKRVVSHVNVDRLDTLVSELSNLRATHEPFVYANPGEIARIMLLPKGLDTNDTAPVPPIAPATISAIQAAFRRSIRFGGSSPTRQEPAINTLSDELTAAVLAGDIQRIAALLAMFHVIVMTYIQGKSKARSSLGLNPSDDPNWSIRIGLSEAAQDAARNNTVKVCQPFITFAFDCMSNAAIESNSRLFAIGSDLATTLFYSSRENSAVGPAIDTEFDQRVSSLLFHVNRRKSIQQEQLSLTTPSDIGCILQAIRFILSLTKRAVECNNAKVAVNFIDRLLEFDRYRELRANAFEHHNGAPNFTQHFIALHLYAVSLITGWCIEVSRQRGTSDAIKGVLQAARLQFTSAAMVIRVWEYATAESRHQSLFSAINWDLFQWEISDSVEKRVGIPHAMRSDTTWVIDGVIALALMADRNWNVDGDPPRGMTYNLQHVEWFLDSLVTDSSGLRDSLSIEAVELSRRIDVCMTTLHTRANATNWKELRLIGTAEISSSRLETLRQRIEKQFNDRRHLMQYLESIASTAEEGTQARITTVRSQIYRNALIEECTTTINLPDLQARNIVVAEERGFRSELNPLFKQANESTNTPLYQRLNDAIRDLTSHGYTPTTVVLSIEHSKLKEMNDRYFLLVDQKSYGGAHVTMFENIPVFRVSAADSFVVVFDAVRGLCRKEPFANPIALSIAIEDLDYGELIARVDGLAQGDKNIIPPDPFDFLVEAVFTFSQRLAVADIGAFRAICV